MPDDTSGSHPKSGVGLVLEQHGVGRPVVIRSIIPGGPCDRGGGKSLLQSGDRLVFVDDIPVAGLDSAELRDLIEGSEGSRVKLGIERDAEPNQRGSQFHRRMDITIVRGFAKATRQSSSPTPTNDDIGTKVIIEGLQEDAVSESSIQLPLSDRFRGDGEDAPPAVPEPAKDKLRHLYNNTPDAERSETPLASYITSAPRATSRPKLDNRAPSPMRLEVRNSVARSPSHRGSSPGTFPSKFIAGLPPLQQGSPGAGAGGASLKRALRSLLMILQRDLVPTDRDCPEVTEAEVGKGYNKLLSEIFQQMKRNKVQQEKAMLVVNVIKRDFAEQISKSMALKDAVRALDDSFDVYQVGGDNQSGAIDFDVTRASISSAYTATEVLKASMTYETPISTPKKSLAISNIIPPGSESKVPLPILMNGNSHDQRAEDPTELLALSGQNFSDAGTEKNRHNDASCDAPSASTGRESEDKVPSLLELAGVADAIDTNQPKVLPHILSPRMQSIAPARSLSLENDDLSTARKGDIFGGEDDGVLREPHVRSSSSDKASSGGVAVAFQSPMLQQISSSSSGGFVKERRDRVEQLIKRSKKLAAQASASAVRDRQRVPVFDPENQKDGSGHQPHTPRDSSTENSKRPTPPSMRRIHDSLEPSSATRAAICTVDLVDSVLKSPLSLRRDERNQHSEAVEADQVGAEMREAASTVIDGKMTIHDSGPDQHLEASTRAQPEEVLKSNPSRLETSPGKEGKLVFNAKSAGLKNIDEIRARHERAKKQNLIPQLLIPDLEDSPRTTADGKSYQPQAILRQPAAPWLQSAPPSESPRHTVPEPQGGVGMGVELRASYQIHHAREKLNAENFEEEEEDTRFAAQRAAAAQQAADHLLSAPTSRKPGSVTTSTPRKSFYAMQAESASPRVNGSSVLLQRHGKSSAATPQDTMSGPSASTASPQNVSSASNNSGGMEIFRYRVLQEQEVSASSNTSRHGPHGTASEKGRPSSPFPQHVAQSPQKSPQRHNTSLSSNSGFGFQDGIRSSLSGSQGLETLPQTLTRHAPTAERPSSPQKYFERPGSARSTASTQQPSRISQHGQAQYDKYYGASPRLEGQGSRQGGSIAYGEKEVGRYEVRLPPQSNRFAMSHSPASSSQSSQKSQVADWTRAAGNGDNNSRRVNAVYSVLNHQTSGVHARRAQEESRVRARTPREFELLSVEKVADSDRMQTSTRSWGIPVAWA